jgi:hypothetical protein
MGMRGAEKQICVLTAMNLTGDPVKVLAFDRRE